MLLYKFDLKTITLGKELDDKWIGCKGKEKKVVCKEGGRGPKVDVKENGGTLEILIYGNQQ